MSGQAAQAAAYREYLEDCGAPVVEELRRSVHRARRDLPKHGIVKGQWYEEWVGLVDDEFTVDRVPLRLEP